MAGETEDQGEEIVTDPAAGETTPAEDAESRPPAEKKPAPKSKPGSGKPADGGGGAESRRTTVEIDAGALSRLHERLDRFERQEQERTEAAKRKDRETIEAEAPKDWKKAKVRLETAHAAEIQDRDAKIGRYETALKRAATDAGLREGIDEWNRQNPNKKVRDDMIPHLMDSLSKHFAPEWDEESGGFVLVEPRTNLLARDVIVKRLADKSYAGFLAASAQPGAGGRGGAARPGAGGGEAATGGKKTPLDAIVEGYRRKKEAFEQMGARPSVGLSFDRAMNAAEE
jgi:hypothetical protein